MFVNDCSPATMRDMDLIPKSRTVFWFILILLVVGLGVYSLNRYFVFKVGPKPIGGQMDAHGCLVGAGYSWCDKRQSCIRPWEEYCTATIPKTAVFNCDEQKNITAKFYIGDDKYVDLTLSDGRKLSVPHAISASGARYANADESFVFWNKGNTAFVTENGTTTFSGCVTTTQ